MRFRYAALVFALCFTFSSGSLAQDSSDLGFEKGKLGSAPGGWFAAAEGWKAELTEEKAAAGDRSVKLFKPGESKAPFGNVMKKMPAAELGGRHISLTAKVLVVGEGRGQMWLRVDRSDGSMGAFDNMDDRPILAGDWADAKIEADIDPDAATLNIGFISLGGATLFIDDVKITLSANTTPIQEASPPRELTPRQAENLTAAARLLSYIRFFHPSDQVVGVQCWENFAVDLMERVEPAANPTELAKRLREAFAALAPTVEIWAGNPDQPPPLSPSAIEAAHRDATQVARWRHSGVGSISPRSSQQIYQSEVEKVPAVTPLGSPEDAVVAKSLGGGISCRIPIAVFADDAGTLPHGKVPEMWESRKGKPKLSAKNRWTRLAGIALGWGVFQHFYPYFDVVKTDWDAALPAALAKASTDKSEIDYLFTLREMVAKLHDGHGGVSNASLRAPSILPLAVEWAGGDLVVVGKHASVTESVSIGDVIVSIDGRSVQDCYTEVSKWISAATDGWRRSVSQRMLVVNLTTKAPARVILRKPDGRTVSAELARVKEFTDHSATSERPENCEELAPGVVYFDLNAAEASALTTAMPQLAGAKAIIFDLRGYPGSAAYELMEHLIDEPATSARWCVPIVRRPDHEGFEWMESGRWPLEPKEPRLNAKIAFLTDGRAISYAESIMGIVENYKLGEIIGSTTAGTNGNINPFTLPGGYMITWTGMKVLKHDGTQHHGIGIAPTIPVVPTAKGIAEGRDEVLEKAVEVMKAKIASEIREEK